MYPFEFQMPTKIVFGAGEVKKTGEVAREFGKKALLVMSKEQSVKKRGFYDKVKSS